jgi:outer membrane protein TolC
LTAIDTIRQQSGNFITVRSAIVPQFGVMNGSYAWLDPQLNNKSNLPENQVPINQTWGLQLQGSQLLYNGGTAIANIKAAKFSEQIAYYNLRVTIDAVIAQVITAFYQVILNRALVVANQQSVELLASQVEDQQSRFEAGTVPRFNVLQAEVQLANAQPALITARNNLRIALFQLVQLIGMNYPNMNSVEVPFEVVGELLYQPRNINVDTSIHTALQRSPTLKSQRHNILMMAENITAALGGYLPTVTATGGYQYASFDSSSTNAAGSTLFNHNLSNFVSGWFFGVQGSWAIFDGLATYGNVKQAKANLMIAKTAYDNSVRQVILNVQQAISNMQQAKETVDSQQENVLHAAEALCLAQERLNAGAGVQLDVLNAQVQLLQAQTTVLQSEYNYIAATAQYDQALSLNTQYEELFDDPMNHREKGRYKILNSSKNPQPLLPRALRATDPLPVEFTIPSPNSQKTAKPRSSPKSKKRATGDSKSVISP